MRIIQILTGTLVLTFLLTGHLISQPEVNMKALAFQDEEGPYIEVQFYFPASSLAAKEIDSTLKYSQVQNTVLVKNGEEIVNYEKYTLTGPKGARLVDLQDILRFRVPEGKLIVEVKTRDVFDGNKKTIESDSVNTHFPDADICFSDIALYSSMRTADADDPKKYIRGGYYVEPLTHDFYHRNLDELISYIEIYGADQTFTGDYALSYVLLRKSGNGKLKEVKRKYRRMTPGSQEGVFLRMDMSDVRSGFYTYRVEAMDRTKKVIATRSERFFRSKPSLDHKQEARQESFEESFVQDMSSKDLDYSLKAIAPKIDQRDVERFNNLIAKGSAESKRSFLYNFWYRVDPVTTKSTYDAYMEVADALDNMYDTGFGYGFETDRGWIYLKYGRPDDMIKVEDDPSAPPYEIWTYYQLPSTSQKNVKFVFYNPHLTTNGFELLHSTARGELNNPQWLLDLYEDAPEEVKGDNFLNADEMQDNWNRHALEYFNDN